MRSILSSRLIDGRFFVFVLVIVFLRNKSNQNKNIRNGGSSLFRGSQELEIGAAAEALSDIPMPPELLHQGLHTHQLFHLDRVILAQPQGLLLICLEGGIIEVNIQLVKSVHKALEGLDRIGPDNVLVTELLASAHFLIQVEKLLVDGALPGFPGTEERDPSGLNLLLEPQEMGGRVRRKGLEIKVALTPRSHPRDDDRGGLTEGFPLGALVSFV